MLVEEDVWNIPIERSRRANHNASFPSELVRRCIEIGSPVGGHVLDPFVGSGTTIFTSLANDRNVVGIDMSPDYIDFIDTSLEADGHQRIEFDKIIQRVSQPSPLWSSWAGNKANFRKPGNKNKGLP
ncbi:hypothetical protein AK51_07505 [Serratia nematodiphila DZ0503SBS1]|nr:hypothetical protein AK51_07505 [Serratia nematodiphila DZ0503SBS1]